MPLHSYVVNEALSPDLDRIYLSVHPRVGKTHTPDTYGAYALPELFYFLYEVLKKPTVICPDDYAGHDGDPRYKYIKKKIPKGILNAIPKQVWDTHLQELVAIVELPTDPSLSERCTYYKTVGFTCTYYFRYRD